MRTGVLVTVAVVLASGLAVASSPSNDAIEQQIRADLAAASEEAARAFDRGNAARDAGRVDEAVAAYTAAIASAPSSSHPHRRLCGVYSRAARHDEAIESCERALGLAPQLAYNQSALAGALLARGTPADVERAFSLARDAAAALPDDVSTTQVWCSAILQSGTPIGLVECSERLLRLEPDGMLANLMATIVAASRNNYDLAHHHLRKAKDAGLPPEMHDPLFAKLDAAQRDANASLLPGREVLEAAGIGLLLWLAFLLGLFAIGTRLSRATLAASEHAATGDASGTPAERRLRKRYRIVLLVSGVYFYLSLPLLIVAVLVTGVGALLIFEAIGAIPLYVVWLIGVLVIGTVIAVVRSLFIRSESKLPGVPLDLAEYPGLRALLDEVAAGVGTRPVDKVHLIPGAEMAVTERGSVWSSLRGKRTDRVLLLGVALFDGMTQLQLRSIVAHEYGHFRNEDTAGGGFALAVRRSLLSLIMRMAESGAAQVYNPVWWFVRGFYRIYLGISQGASRLQEVLADRWAIGAYGSAAFIAGYRHVIERTVEVEQDLPAVVQDAIDNEWALVNIYDVEPNEQKPEAERAADIAKELDREPTVYDSHPSPRQRLRCAEQLAVVREPRPDDDARVWDLFPDGERIELAMTALVRDDVRERLGIVLADRDPEESDERDLATESA